MRAGNWTPLVALRERRADRALADRQRADCRCREVAARLETATHAFDRDEARRADQRRAVYESIAGRALSIGELTRLRDGIHAGVLESLAQRDGLSLLTEQRRAAIAVAEQATALHNTRRRSVEKSESIRQKLILEEGRKAEIRSEIDLEDVTIVTRGGRHAG